MPNTELNSSIVKVAVGIVKNPKGEFLVAKRPKGKHLEDLWEFPGGKVEVAESLAQALRRELKEETGITVSSVQHLFDISHSYAEKQVLLHILFANDFSGTASGCEGQQVKWVSLAEMVNLEFPEANKKIIEYLIANKI